jgi:hypothetical protein
MLEALKNDALIRKNINNYPFFQKGITDEDKLLLRYATQQMFDAPLRFASIRQLENFVIQYLIAVVIQVNWLRSRCQKYRDRAP